ncbi:negative regulator of RAS-cAMP pathway [Kluyveromyces marxianus DMKU3-1042]|uniref:Negative regulator of RAS-cAMP pathway n=2 Tax=Kluyveromyces marxianus TaxID=4911 RepID=W0TBL0_KLUMD|nr:negative regulator of RAS-cAMP pathway [Kluyveromyces marxianus DMKU3-1042]BAO40398.1 negative regulator of RAS-cAMP pathway [Kluyveromyces marxianus DMKU3-1042]
MGPKMYTSAESDRFQMLHSSSNVEHERDHTFLKVTPTLFTQDKLPLFDSLDLYTSLIKCSKFMEQGERLHNLSWRIINKSLLKDQNINKSKKRDGVRNLYNVINPIKQTHSFLHLQQKPKSIQNGTALKTNGVSNHSTNDTSNNNPIDDDHNNRTTTTTTTTPNDKTNNNTNNNADPSNARLNALNNSHSHSRATSALSQISISKKLLSTKSVSPEPVMKSMDTPSRSQSTTPHLRKEAVRKKITMSPELVMSATNDIHPSHHGSIPNHSTISESRLDGQSQTSLFSRNPSSKSLFAKNAHSAIGTGNNSNNSSAKGSTENLKTTKADRTLGETKNTSANTTTDHKNMFFSSEDEESDWDSLSDDSDIYDDDEDNDQYYENQWEELMFSKTNTNQAANHVVSKESGEKKSLLSGLFMQEKQVKSQSVSPPGSASVIKPLEGLPAGASKSIKNSTQNSEPILVRSPDSALKFRIDSDRSNFLSQNHPAGVPIQSQPVAPETSDIVAVGSVTPSSSWQNKGLPIPPAFERSRRLGSFSSIVSDTTRERYYHESNAPPAAQTILPTALSTHMFLPNNIHQQRMALRGGLNNYSQSSGTGREREREKVASRRQSMDIPSKNRNNSFIKTRMEISEEESFARVYARGAKK